MAPMKRADFTCEIPAKSSKEIQNTLEIIEKEIQKLGGGDIKITSTIDGITANGYTVTIKIETVTEDMSSLKKDIWILLGEKVRGK